MSEAYDRLMRKVKQEQGRSAADVPDVPASAARPDVPAGATRSEAYRRLMEKAEQERGRSVEADEPEPGGEGIFKGVADVEEEIPATRDPQPATPDFGGGFSGEGGATGAWNAPLSGPDEFDPIRQQYGQTRGPLGSPYTEEITRQEVASGFYRNVTKIADDLLPQPGQVTSELEYKELLRSYMEGERAGRGPAPTEEYGGLTGPGAEMALGFDPAKYEGYAGGPETRSRKPGAGGRVQAALLQAVKAGVDDIIEADPSIVGEAKRWAAFNYILEGGHAAELIKSVSAPGSSHVTRETYTLPSMIGDVGAPVAEGAGGTASWLLSKLGPMGEAAGDVLGAGAETAAEELGQYGEHTEYEGFVFADVVIDNGKVYDLQDPVEMLGYGGEKTLEKIAHEGKTLLIDIPVQAFQASARTAGDLLLWMDENPYMGESILVKWAEDMAREDPEAAGTLASALFGLPSLEERIAGEEGAGGELPRLGGVVWELGKGFAAFMAGMAADPVNTAIENPGFALLLGRGVAAKGKMKARAAEAATAAEGAMVEGGGLVPELTARLAEIAREPEKFKLVLDDAVKWNPELGKKVDLKKIAERAVGERLKAESIEAVAKGAEIKPQEIKAGGVARAEIKPAAEPDVGAGIKPARSAKVPPEVEGVVKAIHEEIPEGVRTKAELEAAEAKAGAEWAKQEELFGEGTARVSGQKATQAELWKGGAEKPVKPDPKLDIPGQEKLFEAEAKGLTVEPVVRTWRKPQAPKKPQETPGPTTTGEGALKKGEKAAPITPARAKRTAAQLEKAFKADPFEPQESFSVAEIETLLKRADKIKGVGNARGLLEAGLVEASVREVLGAVGTKIKSPKEMKELVEAAKQFPRQVRNMPVEDVAALREHIRRESITKPEKWALEEMEWVEDALSDVMLQTEYKKKMEVVPVRAEQLARKYKRKPELLEAELDKARKKIEKEVMPAAREEARLRKNAGRTLTESDTWQRVKEKGIQITRAERGEIEHYVPPNFRRKAPRGLEPDAFTGGWAHEFKIDIMDATVDAFLEWVADTAELSKRKAPTIKGIVERLVEEHLRYPESLADALKIRSMEEALTLITKEKRALGSPPLHELSGNTAAHKARFLEAVRMGRFKDQVFEKRTTGAKKSFSHNISAGSRRGEGYGAGLAEVTPENILSVYRSKKKGSVSVRVKGNKTYIYKESREGWKPPKWAEKKGLGAYEIAKEYVVKTRRELEQHLRAFEGRAVALDVESTAFYSRAQGAIVRLADAPLTHRVHEQAHHFFEKGVKAHEAKHFKDMVEKASGAKDISAETLHEIFTDAMEERYFRGEKEFYAKNRGWSSKFFEPLYNQFNRIYREHFDSEARAMAEAGPGKYKATRMREIWGPIKAKSGLSDAEFRAQVSEVVRTMDATAAEGGRTGLGVLSAEQMGRVCRTLRRDLLGEAPEVNIAEAMKKAEVRAGRPVLTKAQIKKLPKKVRAEAEKVLEAVERVEREGLAPEDSVPQVVPEYVKPGRGVVNIFGTPEYVLEGRGIVEVLREGKDAYHTDYRIYGERFKSVLKGIGYSSMESHILGWLLDNKVKPETLKGYEKAVPHVVKAYHEVRAVLDELAVKLGLEPGQRVSYYFTHLFRPMKGAPVPVGHPGALKIYADARLVTNAVRSWKDGTYTPLKLKDAVARLDEAVSMSQAGEWVLVEVKGGEMIGFRVKRIRGMVPDEIAAELPDIMVDDVLRYDAPLVVKAGNIKELGEALNKGLAKEAWMIQAGKKRKIGLKDAHELVRSRGRSANQHGAMVLVELGEGTKLGVELKAVSERGLPEWESGETSYKVKMPFLEHRTGVQGYDMCAIQALRTYLPTALKKIHKEPAALKVQPLIEALGEKRAWSERNFAEGLVNEFLGRPSRVDMAWNSLVEPWKLKGVRGLERLPYNAPKRVSVAIKSTYYRGLLGLAVDSAMKNLSQLQNTIVSAGSVPTAKGAMKAFHKGLKRDLVKEMRDAGVMEEWSPVFEANGLPRQLWKGTARRLDDIIFAPFNMAEYINRGISYYTMLEKCKRAGMNEAASVLEAKRFIRETQFGYSELDLSPYTKGPFSRLFTQFSTYPIKQSEFIYRMLAKSEGKPSHWGFARVAQEGAALVSKGLEMFTPEQKAFHEAVRAYMLDANRGKAIRFMALSGFMLTVAGPAIDADLSEIFVFGYLPGTKFIAKGYSPAGQLGFGLFKGASGRGWEDAVAQAKNMIPAYRYGRKALGRWIPGVTQKGAIEKIWTDDYRLFSNRDIKYMESSRKTEIYRLLGLHPSSYTSAWEQLTSRFKTKRSLQQRWGAIRLQWFIALTEKKDKELASRIYKAAIDEFGEGFTRYDWNVAWDQRNMTSEERFEKRIGRGRTYRMMERAESKE